MNIKDHQIELVRSLFAQMSSKSDFLELLNQTKSMIYGQELFPFNTNHLIYFTDKNRKKFYKEFKIKKKSGSYRTIYSPTQGLKEIQKVLSVILQCVFTPHELSFGFVKNKNIVDNAKIHERQDFVFNIDLKDYFTSIDKSRVWKCLQLSPFYLNDSRERFDIAEIISSICTVEMEVERYNEKREFVKLLRYVTPQGAPTSPVLSNIICQRLDYLLTGLAKRFGVKYSRYADDITFSSNINVFKNDVEFYEELNRIIEDQRFAINKTKTRIQTKDYRQIVTGLVVNSKANVSKKYIKELRMWLYYWERYGYEKASHYFLKHYLLNRPRSIKGSLNMSNVISGKLHFLKMIKGADNDLYVKLINRYELLKMSIDLSACEAPDSV